MIRTYSKFYFGHTVTSENNLLDFTEAAGPELTATLNTGDYTLTEYAAELKRALDAAGGLTYTVAVNRTTRAITISASTTFGLLSTTGTHIGNGSFTMMGMTGADKTGTNTYTGSASGSSYSPQFYLQDYKSVEDIQRAVDSNVLKSASGKVEVVTFGTEKFIQCKIRLSTDIAQNSASPIRNNATGVTDLRTFMQYIITKAKIEFIPDENTVATFHKVILESTEENQQGTGYELRERYDIGIPGYYDTSMLRFREVS